MAEQLIGRLIRSCGLSDDRLSMASRLAGFGDFAAAEAVKSAAPLLAISDFPSFRENFAILFDRLPTISVFDSVLPDMVPAAIRGQIIAGSPLALFEVSEGQPIQFAFGNFTDEGELLPLKVGGLIGYTKEFLRNLAPEIDDALNRAFLNALASATDRALINRLITNAGGAIAATNDFSADILAASELILGDRIGKLHMIVAPQTARQIAFATNTNDEFLFPNFDLVNGGSIGGLQTHVSDQLPQDSSGPNALIFDASQIAANRGSVDIQRSENASVQMLSDPTTGATTMVSSFQTNSVILRILRTFGLKMSDDETIAVEFTGASSWFS